MLPWKVLLLVTKKGHRLPKIMRGARSLVNTSKLMFQKKTVSKKLACFRCLCTCSVNVQTWKLIFMFAFVSTLFSNTTNVIEFFLHNYNNLTLKVLYDVLGLGQTPWWWLCWRSACRISYISACHSSIQILLWPWDIQISLIEVWTHLTFASHIMTNT